MGAGASVAAHLGLETVEAASDTLSISTAVSDISEVTTAAPMGFVLETVRMTASQARTYNALDLAASDALRSRLAR